MTTYFEAALPPAADKSAATADVATATSDDKTAVRTDSAAAELGYRYRAVNVDRRYLDWHYLLDVRCRESVAGAALSELRWHWTVNPDGPRVPVTEYARQVGVSHSVISEYAWGWDKIVSGLKPTSDLADARKLAVMGQERATATEAVAKAEGIAQLLAWKRAIAANNAAKRARIRKPKPKPITGIRIPPPPKDEQ